MPLDLSHQQEPLADKSKEDIMEIKFMKVTLEGQKVIVIKGDNKGDYTGSTIKVKDEVVTIGAKLPINFSTSTVWSIA